MKLRSLIPLLLLALLTGGCATSIADVAGKAVGAIAKPVFMIAVPDARTTLAWIDVEVDAGRLSEVDEELARQCPEAVLALDALRTELEGAKEEVEGLKGLIFYATEKRFGRGPQADLTLHLTRLANSCIELIPTDRLVDIF